MAKDTESESAAPVAGGPAPDLRLLDRRAFVGFPPLTVAPGLVISDFALQIPDVSFPFNLTGGAFRYQRKTLLFGLLELVVDAELLIRRVAEVSAQVSELEELKLHFRPGYLEGQARLRQPERTPLTFKVAFDGDGDKLAVYLYDVRLYGFSSLPAPRVAVLLSQVIAELELLPGVELRGATGFSSRLLPQLCQWAAVSRGFRVPLLDQARLSAAEVSSQGLRLRFSAGGVPPPTAFDEELLLTLEGARAFAEAEALVAQGKLVEAREAYLRHGDATEAHPFAAERLLSLLVADPQAHEMALDVAASLLKRRDRSPAALWGEAVVRERRGEGARAAERYLALCALSRKASEETAAFFAAEAAARAGRDRAPQMAVKALHELLGLRPDHLPSLKSLARASDLARDRAGAIRAYRRIAALAREPTEAAEAHVHMARLSAETEDDVAGARLHCEAALRLAPDHPDALYLLGELCYRSGEHLRAIRALDRLREVAMARHELPRVGQASLLAGKVWEGGLEQPENALLRYREAASLLASEPEPHYLVARVAEALGKLQEALTGYQQAVELAGPGPVQESARKAAHASLHALARLHRTRLGDPAKARELLEAALALDPRDVLALNELIPSFRAAGRAAELADACEKAALVTEDAVRRAAYWAEAGEMLRTRLGNVERAERLLLSACEADPRNRMALEGLLSLAESRRDGPQLCRCLKSLAELSAEPSERARLYRRLAVAARDLAFDLELAAHALDKVLELEPEDLAALGELCALHRRRSDMGGLASALERRARVAEAQGDRRLASAALRELSQILEVRLGRLGEALVALEKAARLSPDQSVLLELADLSLRCDRPQHARRALEDVLAQLSRGGGTAERLADVQARLGRACELLDDVDAAIEHYAQAFPLRRLDDALAERLEALYTRLSRRKELGDLWYARAQALTAAERRVQAAPLYFQSAEALLERGEREAALTRYEAALEAAPEGERASAALARLAELELSRGHRPEAARALARRAALTADAREAARLLFQSATHTRDSSAEVDYLDRAIERDATFAPAHVRRAELLGETAPSRALADIEAVLRVDSADPDAPPVEVQVALARKAATAASASNKLETARSLLTSYVEKRPEDLEAQRELAALHRRAGAREALCDLLAGLWPRLPVEEQGVPLREYAALCLELSRLDAAKPALRELRARDPLDVGSARALLPLLPPIGQATSVEEDERLALLTVLISQTQGEEMVGFRARRAELHHAQGRLDDARADYAEAARVSEAPRELLRQVAEMAREAHDERGELLAWKTALARAPELADVAQSRLLALSSARLGAKDFASAREGYAAATALPLSQDDRCEAWLGLAEAALGLGELVAAAAAFDEAASAGPLRRRLDALLQRAALLEAQGALTEAAQALARARELSPGNPISTQAYKRVLRALADWQTLAAVLSEEATTAPRIEAAALYEELGHLALGSLRQPALAEEAFTEVAKRDKENVEARRLLAALLFARGEPVRAADWLDEAASAATPSQAAALLWDGARHARAASQPDLFLRLARAAARFQPPQGEALAAFVDALYTRGAVAEALPLAKRLVDEVRFDKSPEELEAAEHAFFTLADLADQAGELDVARKALERLVAERPLSESAAERLAALVSRSDVRAGLEILWAHARRLPATERTSQRLRWLAGRAQAELSDVELAARMLERAAGSAEHPLEIHLELCALYRAAHRAPELMAELVVVAKLRREGGDLPASISALLEAADLAEQAGRAEEALSMLESTREMLEQEGNGALAARVECRRAELLRDVRLDLAAAAEALERSFRLAAELNTARLGGALARQRDDARAEAEWLTREVPLCGSARERGYALLALARLYEGPLGNVERTEQALREALQALPGLTEAQTRLEALLVREGRVVDLAALREEAAAREGNPQRRVALLLEAAALYRDRAGRPDDAAAALLAARAVVPDDLELTAKLADHLHETGHSVDASEFDALLLEVDPFRARVFERHVAFLEEAEDFLGLATLRLRRAQRQDGVEAARSYLEAANAFRSAGAQERALLCEDQAFESAPESGEAFTLLRERAEGDVRRLTELLFARARVLPPREALPLLRERAERLNTAGELLRAAAAYDDVLQVAADDVPALLARAELAAREGGPVAAQPYDRRLLSVGETLAAPLRIKAQLRLGHAALGNGALRDAADALEAVVLLDPEGEKGREALSLLAEVHAKTNDVRGLYRTSLALARRAGPDESEALLRRAAALFPDAKDALEALLSLAALRPGDAPIIDRAAEALRALGRYGDLLEFYEKGAEAAGGGPRAAELLRAAARVAESELSDPERAFALKKKAGEVAPHSGEVLRELAQAQRERKDRQGLAQTLDKLLAHLGDADEAGPLWLERAELARAAGETTRAREALEAVEARGPERTGYREALEGLLTLARASDDDVAEARLLSLQAELTEGEEKASLLLSAAKLLRFVDAAAATQRALDALNAFPTAEAALFLAELYGAQQDLPRAGEVLARAAQLSPEGLRGPLLLKAAYAREASGAQGEAATLFERVARDHPELLSRSALADHLLRLNRPERALEVGFEPALRVGEPVRALALADAVQDAEKAREALWKVAEQGGAEATPFVERLAKLLRDAQDGDGLLKLSSLSMAALPKRALSLAEEVATGNYPPGARIVALERLERAERLQPALELTLATLGASSTPELVEWCLSRVRGLAGEERHRLFGVAADALPWRANGLWRELANAERSVGQGAGAVAAIERLLESETDPLARIALRVEQAEVYVQARLPLAAREVLEGALTEGAGDAITVLKPLLELHRSAEPSDRYVALAEKVRELQGDEALTSKQMEVLVLAYEKRGRVREAYELLVRMEETPARLEKRSGLALQLGLVGDALQIREKLARSWEELDAVLFGYLVGDLIPFAVKLAERLLEMGAPLDGLARRMVAEKASLEPEGAALAARLWPWLLRDTVTDVDGWTLYSEALARLGKKDEAQRMDGFGAALSGSQAPAPPVSPRRLRRTRYDFSLSLPEGVVPINAKTMPRLHGTLSQLLGALGAPDTSVFLHVEGGAVAYLVRPEVLLLGTGALSCFGTSELSYLCALALAVGERGHLLAGPGPVEGLEVAAAAAFAAVPASLAACRVLAQLHEDVRGGDPSIVDVSQVLRKSTPFRAIALQALLLA